MTTSGHIDVITARAYLVYDAVMSAFHELIKFVNCLFIVLEYGCEIGSLSYAVHVNHIERIRKKKISF